MMLNIEYAVEPHLDVEEFIDVLSRSTLAARRPIDCREQMDGMLRHASLIVTARQSSRLVGVSRALTDFSYSTYLADLAVDEECQRQGIGHQLLRLTHEHAGLHTTLILLAAPAAVNYYPHIGMTAHPSCWIRAASPEFPSRSI